MTKLADLTDAYGQPIIGYLCMPDCLAYQDYGYHKDCQRVDITALLGRLDDLLASPLGKLIGELE